MKQINLIDSIDCIKNFQRDGITLIPSQKASKRAAVSRYDLTQRARQKLENQFANFGYPQTLNISDIKDQELICLLHGILQESGLKSFFEALENQYNTPVTLFPNVIQRNLFPKIVDGHIHNDDWHRDCAGMLQYKYCKK